MYTLTWFAKHVLRGVVKKQIFYAQAGRKGVGGSTLTVGLTVKYPFFYDSP